MDPFACRPVARDITIENTTNATIYVEFSFSSAVIFSIVVACGNSNSTVSAFAFRY